MKSKSFYCTVDGRKMGPVVDEVRDIFDTYRLTYCEMNYLLINLNEQCEAVAVRHGFPWVKP